MKKISVLTPSFNSDRYIENAIINVLKQGYVNFEHIIIDGGSTDNTISILEKYPHLVWVSEKDKGQSDAMNKAFALSTGDIIVYLNADDFFEDNIFNLVAEEFTIHHNIDIVVGNGIKMNAGGKVGDWTSVIEYKKCLHFYTYQFPLNPVSYFYKREVQEQIPYNTENHYTMDYEFLLRAFQLFKAKKLEHNFGYFFEDGHNKTSNMERAYQNLKRTLIRHCVKHDPIELIGILSYFLRKKFVY